ncbi:MAG TPA: hypothetical protein PKC21_06865 [Oligoflexia bacterium]|nr:hypothetical protein [Oligoflexia bacterium]HMR25058.1 hypothetical protein [Oligoflexia bacterium]
MKQTIKMVLLILILGCIHTACQKNTIQYVKNQNQRDELDVVKDIQEGYFSYMADANMFISCDGNSKNSILMQGKTYLELEKKYLALNLSPQKVYLKMQAKLINNKTEQKELKKPVWLIENLIELDKNKSCSKQQ